MADNDSDRTVKLPATGSKPVNPDSTSQIPVSPDSTQGITPPAQSAPAAPPAAAAPVPPAPVVRPAPAVRPAPNADATMKLSAQPAAPASAPAAPPVPAPDATVKLSASSVPPARPRTAPDATVKMSAAPAPELPKIPDIPSMPTLPSDSAPAGHGNMKKVLASVLGGLVLMLGGGWYALPIWLGKSAAKLSGQGKHADAAKKLQFALALFPLNCEELTLQSGRELRLAKDYGAAETQLKKLLERKADHPEALRELGMAQNESGQKAQAYDTFQKVAPLLPQDLEIARWSGDIAFGLKNYAGVEKNYGKLGGQATADELHRLAVAQHELKQDDKALESLKAALAKKADLKEANGLAGKIHLAYGRYAEAAAAFEKEAAVSPNQGQLAESYAEACQKAAEQALAKRDRATALALLTKGSGFASARRAAMTYQIGTVHAQLRKRAEALKFLGEAVKQDAAIKAFAKKDPAFAAYRKLPQFQKIVR